MSCWLVMLVNSCQRGLGAPQDGHGGMIVGLGMESPPPKTFGEAAARRSSDVRKVALAYHGESEPLPLLARRPPFYCAQPGGRNALASCSVHRSFRDGAPRNMSAGLGAGGASSVETSTATGACRATARFVAADSRCSASSMCSIRAKRSSSWLDSTITTPA